MKPNYFGILGLVVLFLVGCGPPVGPTNIYRKSGTYSIMGGQFNEPIATIIVDRNGTFDVSWATGSAFLLDSPQNGLFGTARHVVDREAAYKVFFNGKVYKAQRFLSSVVTDVAFIRIIDRFDPSQFPKPYPIADKVNINDRVFIRGIHPHPYNMQDKKVVHGIIRGFYGLSRYSSEFVYDDLPGTITNLNIFHENKVIVGSDSNLGSVILQYSQVMADDDHSIVANDSIKGFQGLSGGPTINIRGEIVGINSVQPGGQGDFIFDRDGLHYRPLVTLELMPASELRRALIQLKSK